MLIDDKEFFEQVVAKLDAVAKDLSEIKLILEKQQGELNMHMYRTELLEKANGDMIARVSPLETKNNYFDGALKGIGVIASVSGLFYVLIEIVKSLSV